MKKKLLFAALIGLSVFTLAACGGKDTADKNPGADTNLTENTAAGSSAEDVYDSVGQMLNARFQSVASGSAELSAEDIANQVIEGDVLPFAAGVMPVSEGLLTGFGNEEIKGFKDGAFFTPMIGSIPFAGYVFILEDGADTEAFKQMLKDNADLRWNICTEADEMVADNVDTKVFFLMCPTKFEEEPE